MSFELIVPDFGLVLPQFAIFITAIVLSLGDAFLPKHLQFKWLTAISLIGYALGLLLLIGQHDRNESTFYGLFRADGLTVFLSLIILSAAILTVLISASYVENLEGKMPLGEYYTLLAFAILGALLTASEREEIAASGSHGHGHGHGELAPVGGGSHDHGHEEHAHDGDSASYPTHEGQVDSSRWADLSLKETLTLLPLAVLTIVFGIYPKPLLAIVEPSFQAILDGAMRVVGN